MIIANGQRALRQRVPRLIEIESAGYSGETPQGYWEQVVPSRNSSTVGSLDIGRPETWNQCIEVASQANPERVGVHNVSRLKDYWLDHSAELVGMLPAGPAQGIAQLVNRNIRELRI